MREFWTIRILFSIVVVEEDDDDPPMTRRPKDVESMISRESDDDEGESVGQVKRLESFGIVEESRVAAETVNDDEDTNNKERRIILLE